MEEKEGKMMQKWVLGGIHPDAGRGMGGVPELKMIPKHQIKKNSWLSHIIAHPFCRSSNMHTFLIL